MTEPFASSIEQVKEKYRLKRLELDRREKVEIQNYINLGKEYPYTPVEREDTNEFNPEEQHDLDEQRAEYSFKNQIVEPKD